MAVAKYKKKSKAIFYHLFDLSTYIAFFSSNGNITSFDCDREAFIGDYRSESNPICVEKGRCGDSEALGGNPIAATCNKIILNPNESKNIIFVLGVTKEKSQATQLIHKFDKIENVENELLKMKDVWDNHLNNLVAETPDKNFNSIINILSSPPD